MRARSWENVTHPPSAIHSNKERILGRSYRDFRNTEIGTIADRQENRISLSLVVKQQLDGFDDETTNENLSMRVADGKIRLSTQHMESIWRHLSLRAVDWH